MLDADIDYDSRLKVCPKNINPRKDMCSHFLTHWTPDVL
jgi:hypothetical protein